MTGAIDASIRAGASPRRNGLPSIVVAATAVMLGATIWHIGDAAIDKAYPLWLDIGISAAFVAAGVAADRSGRGLTMSAPLVLAGWCWIPQVLAPSANSWVFTLSLAGAALWVGPVVHAALAFPDGRLRGRAAVVAVMLAWLHGTALWLLQAMFTLRRETPDIPENHVKVAGEHPSLNWVGSVARGVPPVISLLLCVAMVTRWRRWTPGQRIRFAPIAVLSLVLFAIHMGIQAADGDLVEELFAGEQVIVALLATALVAASFGDVADRAAVGRFVLGAGASGKELESALATALRDPLVSVTKAEDGDGNEPPMEGRQSIDLALGDRRVGTLHVDGGIDHDRDVLAAASRLTTLILERERLASEAEANLAAVEASRARILEAVDAERRRIERNLHDGAQQHLVGIAIQLNLLRMATEDSDLAESLGRAISASKVALAELRSLARGLHPVLLIEAGLEAALFDAGNRAPVPTETRVSGLDGASVPLAVQATCYYVVSEALANVAKYAEATRATVRLEVTDHELRIEVRDDGRGGARLGGGSGLVGLEDRVGAAGGQLTVDSPEGLGTTISARFPVGPDDG